MTTRVFVDTYDRVEDRTCDSFVTTRDGSTCSHSHVINEEHDAHDGMQHLIHSFKKFSFPSLDEYTRIELEQERRRKSSTERPKSGSYPSEFSLDFEMEGGCGSGGCVGGVSVNNTNNNNNINKEICNGIRRTKKTKEYVVPIDDDDEDNFMVLSTRENIENITIRDENRENISVCGEYNILNDELKDSLPRDDYPPRTMVPICDIDYISAVPENAENSVWRHRRGADSSSHEVREYTEIEHRMETRSKGNQTDTEDQEKQESAKSSAPTAFMSKNEVRDLLREFNEDYRRNTEIIVKEMRESTSSLIRNFQETVTFSFREITATLKEMEEQNNRMNLRHNDVLSEDVELLYNKIMEDNQEIKGLVAGLMESPVNKQVECEECQRKDSEREGVMEGSRNLSGPEEKISETEVRYDDCSTDCVDPPLPTPSKLDDYVCEIIVCTSPRKMCSEKIDMSPSPKKACAEMSDACPAMNQHVYQATEAELNERNAACERIQKLSNTKCEVVEKLEELRKQAGENIVAVERIATHCSPEDNWFKDLKSIHKSVHSGM